MLTRARIHPDNPGRWGLFLFENGNVGSIQQIDLAARPVESEKSKSELSITMNNPALAIPGPLVSSVSSVPGRSSLFPTLGPGGSWDGHSVDPSLEVLLEQIKALREEMNQILGKRSPDHGFDRFSRDRGQIHPLGFLVQRQNPGAGQFFDTKGR